MEKNTIRVGENKVEALENGGVSLNGERISSIEEVEVVLNYLIKATISLVQG